MWKPSTSASVQIIILLQRRFSKLKRDNSLLDIDQMVMNEDTKKKIREECGISSAHFQVIMGKLRKNRVIVDGKINPRFIPNISEDDTGVFQLLLLFDLNDDR